MAASSLFFSPATILGLLLLFSIGSSVEGVLFSKLKQTLIVTASPNHGQVLKAGEDKLTVSWALNSTVSDSSYKQVKVILCYAPVSQKDRGWRKTVDDLSIDKTCQFDIITKPYTKSKTTFEYMVKRNVPTATYFIRAYVLDFSENEVAYGQTTDAAKTTKFFDIIGISGRTASLDIAAGCFSAFSILSLVYFFVKEKRMAKK
ncbi:uncharacterized protein A4U43_C09F11170 [Asparagus officinalis]|uniref:High-affinity nitrate transporter n=2 Tax=Asparagus officinalis TaxID=4686 RepID=A0A5P1EA59_ASPOF|nr:uncharacterized protein A4U43_C09F11170 [Asparagus officinalis]